MANEATIRVNTKVSGLSELEKANSLLKEVDKTLSGLGKNASSDSLSGLLRGINKAKSEAKELESSLKKIDDISFSKLGTSATEGLSKAETKATELKSKLEQATRIKGEGLGKSISEGVSSADRSVDKLKGSVKESISAEKELASAAKSVAEAESRSASAAEKGASARKQAANSAKQERERQVASASGYQAVSERPAKKEGKITGAIRDVAGMYTLGNLAANGIMSAGEGIKELFGSGLSYISQQQASEVSWASNARSVNKLLGKNMSASQATKFSKGMVKDIQNVATQAGNDYSQVSDAALAFYATGAGVSTAGNKKKTLQLTKDMLNLQDAGGMNDEEMGRFISSVAKTLDQDKLTTERLNQLKAFNPNIDEYLERAHKQRTGKDAKKPGEYTGNDLVEALHMAGMAPGVSDASKKMNQSLQGTQRAVKNGMVRMTAGFEEQLGKALNKSFGGDGKLFSRITDWFNDPKKTESFTKKMANGTAGVVTTAGHVGKEAFDVAKKLSDVAKPVAGGFGTGFIDQVKTFKRGLVDAYRGVKSTIGNLTDKIPKGTKKNLTDFGKSLGQQAGKGSAYLLAIRGLSKLPGIGTAVTKAFQPLLGLVSKVPLVGKGLSGLLSKITGIQKIKSVKEGTAAGKMQNAANTMMSAANKMNGKPSANEFRRSGGVNTTRSAIEDTLSNNLYDTGGLTRTELYHGADTTRYARAKNNPNAWFNRAYERGQQILGPVGTRQRANAGLVTRIKGGFLSGVGRAGQKVLGESRVGNALYRGTLATGRGLKAAGKFIGKGAPGMNALFAGMDALSVLGTTKAGSLARHKGIGGAIGGGVGSTLGMAAGSLLGPVGTAVGGIAGQWLGNKAGEWIGGMFGGSKSSNKPKQSWSQRQQSKAEKDYARDQFISNYGQMYKNSGQKATVSAASAYRTLNAAQKGNSKARTASMHYQDAMQAGDIASAEKYRKQMASQVKSEDAKDIRSAQKSLSNAKKNQSKAYGEAYKRALNSLKMDPNSRYRSSKDLKKLAKATALNSRDYKKAASRTKSAQNKLSSRKRKYRNETGEDYKPRSKKTSVHAKTKGTKSVKKLSKATKGVRSKKASVKAKTSGGKKVKQLSKDTKKVRSKKAHVKAKTSGGKKVKQLSKDTKKVKNKKAKIKAKTSGGKKVKQLSKDTKKVKNKKAKIKAKTSGGKQVKKLAKDTKKVKNKKAKVTAKTKGSKNVKKLSKDLKKVKNKKAKVSVKTSGSSLLKKLSNLIKKVKNKKATVKAKTTGNSKVKQLSKDLKKVKNRNVKVTVKTSGSSKVKSLSRDIKRLKGKSVRVTARASGTSAVNKLKGTIRSLKNKTARVTAHTSGTSQVTRLKSAINGVKNKNVSVIAKVTGTGQVKALTSAINTVKGKKVSVVASVSGTSQVRALVSAINAVHSKTVSITANVHKSGHLATGSPGAVAAFSRLATGTPRFALAKGTPAATTAQWSANGGVKKGTYLVNDAPGADFVEAFMTKAGTIGLFPKQRNLLVPLDEGTQVLNAKDTKKRFPRLEKGTLSFDGTTNNHETSNNSQKIVQNHNTFNINVTVDTKGGPVDKKTIQKIANEIAEKLTIAFPETEV
ncbi:hypothetical protein [Lactobacillus taiwanensis]|uniref:hypothetical protein n=1 Tax=Lactobacillus taiwanensis TaxID=508451 RepID=UPI000B99CAA0|nr:hypothetical protein [Lactobacillus taiwanensis]OYR95120.1 hypothetical protein CBF51_09130 [Lactobacillus taiwanensis]OYS02485.1 hypothetical protein CBF61_02295 [Lactobacillus taiwanensis]OYS16204.1 hypothetical protein CBF69_02475 [Lactobacillus taiwanensis]OYS16307.1 hypothetical protein CBF69_03080 [Lactobacillus taiwanensis]OYS32337.1 hypothetical protein CBF85_10485 [Lactobacillus taiwanensis]